MRFIHRRLRRWSCGLAGLMAAAQVGGCLPDNAFRLVLSEQIVQSYALGVTGLTSLLFGLPDLILNSLVINALAGS